MYISFDLAEKHNIYNQLVITMSYTNPGKLQNPASLRRKIYTFVRERSLVELLKEIWTNGIPLSRRLIGLYFDKKFDQIYQVDTCGSIHLYELSVTRSNTESCSIYDPIPARTIRNLIANIPRDFSDYNFIDFGSGKGRALFVAAEYNLQKIIGIEFARELHETTLKNIKQYKNPNQKCFDIESICCDATEYAIPDGKCIFFFFAPFGADIFSQVMDNIRKSYEQNNRDMVILYVTDPITHPFPSQEIKCDGLFTKIRGGNVPFDIAQRDNLYYEIYQIN
ncbi:hypothetical protein NIES3974_35490 [Calothrix sp. NIES-3974]|nr:hypothetical protein NIES3974_35490 [Calothrix sp. NIES-3974]